MKLYITTISKTGGFVATSEKPQVSKLGLRRKPGQRYQIASVVRHVTEELKNPELVDAVALFMEDIKQDIEANGFCEISWAVPSEDPVKILSQEDNQWIEINRKWANWDMEKLDEILMYYMGQDETEDEPDTQGAGNGNGNVNQPTGGGNGNPKRQTVKPQF